MRSFTPLLAFLLCVAAPAKGQAEPGWGYTWEQVGQAPLDADAFVVDARGTLWVSAADAVRWLDLTNGPPGVWQPVTYFWPGSKPDAMIALGPDSLLGSGGGVRLTVDGGATWPEVWDEGEYAIYEVPTGHPAAGRILVGTGAGGLLTGAGYSTDRGATWALAPVSVPHSTSQHRLYGFAAVPLGTVPGAPARVLGAADWGVYLSDDGGLTWHASSLFAYGSYIGRFVAALARPVSAGGGVRLLFVTRQSTVGTVRTFHSDDGGETWVAGPDLDEPPGDGLGWPNADALVELGGSSALVMLGRGRIHRTDDGGATWREVAQPPRPTTTTTASTAVLGADGRLYVAMTATGTARAWVYRTAEVVAPTTATPALPTDGTALRLGVVPNPATGAVTLTLALPAAGPVRLAVYDGLGREIAVLLDGARGAGTHTVPFDGAALPPGVYLVRATAGGATVTAPLTLTR